MRIAVACGGTGGHILPGAAAAEALRRRGHDVQLWLAGKPGESTALAGWNGPVMTVRARGLAGASLPGRALAAGGMILAAARCVVTIRRRRLQALLAMGSYASVGPVLAAHWLSVPVVLHEANVIPGRAVRFLASRADALALGFPEAARALGHPHTVITGIPIRERPPGADPEPGPWRGLAEGQFTLLVMGGSRGARALNSLAGTALCALHQAGCPLQVIHLAGAPDAAALAGRYRAAGLPHAVFAFLHDMPRAYRRADLAVCRSGAATCAELAAFGVPALLVPYPHAADRHQQANARALADAGAATVCAESDLTAVRLADLIRAAAAEPARLAAMRQAARALSRPDAAERLADLVETAARGRDAPAAQPPRVVGSAAP